MIFRIIIGLTLYMCLSFNSYASELDSSIYHRTKIKLGFHSGMKNSPSSFLNGNFSGALSSRAGYSMLYGSTINFPLTFSKDLLTELEFMVRFTSISTITKAFLNSQVFGLDKTLEASFRESNLIFETGMRFNQLLRPRSRYGLELIAGVHIQYSSTNEFGEYQGELSRNGNVSIVPIISWDRLEKGFILPNADMVLGVGYRIPFNTRVLAIRLERNFSQSTQYNRRVNVVNTGRSMTGIQEIKLSYWALQLAIISF